MMDERERMDETAIKSHKMMTKIWRNLTDGLVNEWTPDENGEEILINKVKKYLFDIHPSII